MAQPGHVLRAAAAAGMLTKGTQVAKWCQVCANWRVMRVFRILLCRQHEQEVSALHMCPLQHAGRQARHGPRGMAAGVGTLSMSSTVQNCLRASSRKMLW